MSDSAAQMLLREIFNILRPASEAAVSRDGVRLLFARIGWDIDAVTGLPIGQLQTALQDFSSALEHIANLVESPPDTLEDIKQAFDAVSNVLDHLRRIPDLAPVAVRPPEFEQIGAELVEVLTTEYMVRHHAVLWRLLVLLTLAAEDDTTQISEVKDPSSGKIVRYPHMRRRLHFQRLGTLIQDPAAALRAEYLPAGLATTADAREAATRLFGRLAGVLRMTGVEVLQGFDPGLGFDLGTIGNDMAAGMLSFQIPVDILDRAGASFGATLALSPTDRGNLGIVVVPFGALKLARSFPDWLLEIDIASQVEAFAIGPDGFVLPAAAPAGGVGLSVSLSKRAAQAGPSVLLGAINDSHIQIGQFSITGEAIFSQHSQDYGLLVKFGAGAIVVQSDDGFLQHVLPKEGLRTDFDLAIGWSNTRSLYVRGGAGLEATLPIHKELLGVLKVDSVYLALRTKGVDIEAVAAATASVSLGPLKVTVERMGLRALVTFPQSGGNLGVVNLELGFKPPNGAGLTINAGIVVGGGYLFFDEQKQQYAGVVQLEIAEILNVTAVGLITTQMPDGSRGFSLLVLIAAQFSPPIQLGYGFTLNGLGGLLGVNCTAAVDVLRAGLRAGTLGSVLFPVDPVHNAARIVSDLGAVFPPAEGRFVFGPMAILGWGPKTLIMLQLGLVLELPEPVRLLILGRLLVVLPEEKHAVVRLQLDSLGVIDFATGDVSLDAVLYDSEIKGFTITGEMALRAIPFGTLIG